MKLPTAYLTESYDELRKVKWPTRHTTIQYSTIVLVSVVVFTLFLAGADYLFTIAIDRITQ